MRGISPYKRLNDNLSRIIETYSTLPSELKDKIAQTLAKLAAFKKTSFDKSLYKVLVEKLVAEGFLFLHTLDNAIAGRIKH